LKLKQYEKRKKIFYLIVKYKYKEKLIYKNKLLFFGVILPIFIYFLYAGLIQSPRYESSAVISIQKNQQGISGVGLGSLLGGMAGGDGSVSSQVVIDHINSLEMYEELDKQINLTKIFQSHDVDFISRLGNHPNQKDKLTYYQSLLTTFYNSQSQTIEIKFQGYSPDESQKILNQIILDVQVFVNGLDQQLTTQRVSFGQKQVAIAQKKLTETEAKIITFQNDKSMLDPKTETGLIAGILANLQSQLVMAETNLADKQAYYQPSSIDIQQLQQRIDSIKAQINIEKQKLLGFEGGDNSDPKLNKLIAEFEELGMQTKIAVAEYAASIQSLEISKSDAIQQKQQVVIIQSPVLPDYSKYPRIWYNMLVMLVILVMIYGIIKMFVRLISEHRY
jgi:capsular polysaccharide transport system permease protein